MLSNEPKGPLHNYFYAVVLRVGTIVCALYVVTKIPLRCPCFVFVRMIILIDVASMPFYDFVISSCIPSLSSVLMYHDFTASLLDFGWTGYFRTLEFEFVVIVRGVQFSITPLSVAL